jgi:hypothetical protein
MVNTEKSVDFGKVQDTALVSAIDYCNGNDVRIKRKEVCRTRSQSDKESNQFLSKYSMF